jgi:hypothetical protein
MRHLILSFNGVIYMSTQHRLQRTPKELGQAAATPLFHKALCQKWRENGVSLASPAAAVEPNS